MIGGTAIAIDVYYKTPFIPLCIGSDGRIFGLLASGITLLGVVVYGVCEFACGGLGLWLPGIIIVVIREVVVVGSSSTTSICIIDGGRRRASVDGEWCRHRRRR